MNCLSFPLPSFPSRLRVSRRRGRRPSEYWTGEGRNLTQIRSTKSTAPKSAAFLRDISASSLDGVKNPFIAWSIFAAILPSPLQKEAKVQGGEKHEKPKRIYFSGASRCTRLLGSPLSPLQSSFLPSWITLFCGMAEEGRGKRGAYIAD